MYLFLISVVKTRHGLSSVWGLFSILFYQNALTHSTRQTMLLHKYQYGRRLILLFGYDKLVSCIGSFHFQSVCIFRLVLRHPNESCFYRCVQIVKKRPRFSLKRISMYAWVQTEKPLDKRLMDTEYNRVLSQIFFCHVSEYKTKEVGELTCLLTRTGVAKLIHSQKQFYLGRTKVATFFRRNN